ncbi:hypothetical protein [Clostridium formicaceticum]|uniref:Uncharacterized protein n=1 Tax=Clostridium formicaceticum TaxID=1497 RepID=A0AAC9WHL6_9CLOT|nr:hypothetical protein [Clostridium formicaceticum]AOY74547.1 hypothetical protein BJL90_00405 [Clostridium formicaceticum]ARE88904.1 hypothetical protein CLFO_33100 [Clostridium formicaceticum]
MKKKYPLALSICIVALVIGAGSFFFLNRNMNVQTDENIKEITSQKEESKIINNEMLRIIMAFKSDNNSIPTFVVNFDNLQQTIDILDVSGDLSYAAENIQSQKNLQEIIGKSATDSVAYLELDLSGLDMFIDKIEGIPFEMEEALLYTDPYSGTVIDIPQNTILNGSQFVEMLFIRIKDRPILKTTLVHNLMSKITGDQQENRDLFFKDYAVIKFGELDLIKYSFENCKAFK